MSKITSISRNYRARFRYVIHVSDSSISSVRERIYRESDRVPGPIREISSNQLSRQRNTTLGLLLWSHRVHRCHHLQRIHNFARSLPNRLLALFLSLSLSFSLPSSFSLISCFRVSGASRSSLGARRHRFRCPTS